MHILRCIGYGTLSGLIFLAGCHSSTAQNPPSEPSPYVHAAAPAPDTQAAAAGPQFEQVQHDPPAAPGTAVALAQRATSFAQSVSPATAKPAAPKPAASDWPDPDAMHLTTPADGLPAPLASVRAEPLAKLAPANASVSLPPTQHRMTTERPVSPTAAPTGGADELGVKLAARARDYPGDLSAQLDHQLLKFLRDEPVPDVSALGGMAPEDRELLTATLDSLTNFRNQLRLDNNLLFSKKIRPLVELGDRLRSQAELSVPVIALCTKVTAFGVYEPIEPARFIAGTENRVVVYCEVENFLSQPNEKNFYETRLSQDIVLYTEVSGLAAWTDKRSTYVDQARHRRRDFFMGKVIALPSNLSIGRYLLKVTVEDQQARHIAENTVPVEIVAQ